MTSWVRHLLEPGLVADELFWKAEWGHGGVRTQQLIGQAILGNDFSPLASVSLYKMGLMKPTLQGHRGLQIK